MAKYWKVILLIILTGLSIILSTALFAMQIMLKQRKQAYKRYREKQIQDEDKRTKFKQWSQTVKKSNAVDPLTELNMRQGQHGPASATNNIVISADAHLALALKGIPFEFERTLLGGNALPPNLLFAESGDHRRGVTFVGGLGFGEQNKEYDAATQDNSSGATNSGETSTFTEGIDGKLSKKRKKRMSGQYKSVWRYIWSYFSKKGTSVHPSDREMESKSSSTNSRDTRIEDKLEIEKKAMFHLERAAELGNSHAQNMLANILVSGILPFEDHPSLRGGEDGYDGGRIGSSLRVQADFAEGGDQLARALILWHLSAMDGNIEAAMSIGYRHYISAKSGSNKDTFITEDSLNPDSANIKKKKRDKTEIHSPSDSAHYGVLGTCESSLAYYEAAANAIVDELEASPLRGKIPPARDYHKLAEIHQRGASSTLASYNKPDELDEAIKYYQMRAKNPQQPDINAAYKVANMYHYGLKGVKQDMKEALEYYEIAADHNSWEAAGQAGKFHLWGMGVDLDKRNLRKAYDYFTIGTPGGIEGCKRRFQKKLTMKEKSVNDDGLQWDYETEIYNCDHPSLNGKGLLHLFGLPMMVSVNVTKAIEYFELAKNLGNNDAYFNLAMMRLGWMNPFYKTAFDYRSTTVKRRDDLVWNSPSPKDYMEAFQLLKRAEGMGHIQAKHRLAMLYSRGIEKDGLVLIPKSCTKALKLYMEIAEAGTSVTKRMRAAYKQYMAGDYESSLRNYLSAAETGSVEAQVNAAFLLEQGFCLGMNRLNCMKASVRMWRAAARSGDEEACLRVGDFYYYGHLREDINPNKKYDSSVQRDIEYSSAPLSWVRYMLYPEDLLPLMKKMAIKSTRWILSVINPPRDNETLTRLGREGFCSNGSMNDEKKCVKPSNIVVNEISDEQTDHFEIAARYYRKAADEHGSARANFNLGFMHEWGLGLTQDFPLAKRFYDVAAQQKNGEGELAVQIALLTMTIHEFFVKAGLFLDKWSRKKAASSSTQNLHYQILSNTSPKTAKDILMYHIFNGETIFILVLALILTMLVQEVHNRRHR